jgi:hypothetical protein
LRLTPRLPFRADRSLEAGGKERLMDAVGLNPGSAGAVEKRARILYSLLLAAATAVIVLSVVGIAAMMGWIAAG